MAVGSSMMEVDEKAFLLCILLCIAYLSVIGYGVILSGLLYILISSFNPLSFLSWTVVDLILYIDSVSHKLLFVAPSYSRTPTGPPLPYQSG